MHQGRIESFLVDAMKETSDIQVERGVVPEELRFDRSKAEDHAVHPITVKVRHSPEEDAAAPREKIRAKYVVGCDGAHSWTRRQLGFKMEGEQTDFVWGVIDLVPITDFRKSIPRARSARKLKDRLLTGVIADIRQACSIHSVSSGSILLIPRERKLVRIYVQLTDIKNADGTVIERSNIKAEMILEAAKKIFHPYTLNWGYIEWWAVYQVSHTRSQDNRKLRFGKIGQRLSNHFDESNRIFLAGDAVHTHSPKAGQGIASLSVPAELRP